MDGQFHAIEFDPSATASEVLKLVRAKIGLREDAEGYAIYEVGSPYSYLPLVKFGEQHRFMPLHSCSLCAAEKLN
jgi:hypothetical protein